MSQDKVQAEIKRLEEELAKTKYNKRTQHHIGLIKARIARLREKGVSKSGKTGEGYSVRKSGDATVVLVGFPSVGKSTLLNKLTNADSKIGNYEFTTLTVIPGVMEYNSSKIQILDVPGIIRGAASGKGRGKEVINVIRSSDLIVIVVEAFNTKQVEVLEKELYLAGIRINQSPPDVKIKKKIKGGVDISWTCRHELDNKTVEGILKEYKIISADVVIREDITIDQLIDVLEGNRVYIPCLVVLNKADMLDKNILNSLKIPNSILISAKNQKNFDSLKQSIFEKLGLIKIFMKEVGKKADFEEPVIIRKGATVGEVCNKLHRGFLKRFRFCRIWGRSAKFPGQRFKANHVIEDGDVVQLHLR